MKAHEKEIIAAVDVQPKTKQMTSLSIAEALDSLWQEKETMDRKYWCGLMEM